jgi:hypothetical protein
VKVSTETKTANGVTLTTTGRRFVKGGQDGVEVLLEPKYNWAAQNVEVTGKISTESVFEAGVSVKDLGAKGSKLSLTGNQAKTGSSAKVGADFKNESVAVKTAGTYPDDANTKPVSVEASAVAAYDIVNFGAKVNFASAYTKAEKETASSFFWNAKLGLLNPLWQAVGFYNNANNSNLVGGSFWQEVSPAVKLGTSFTVDRVNEKAASPAASIAGDYKIAADTSAKAKVSVSHAKDLRLALALQQNWTTSSTVTLGTDLNALQLLGSNSGSAHTFGLEVKLK